MLRLDSASVEKDTLDEHVTAARYIPLVSPSVFYLYIK
jgi:hypothetical protein